MPGVFHANWSGDALHLWCERGDGAPAPMGPPSEDDLRRVAPAMGALRASAGELTLRLPAKAGVPTPSGTLARTVGSPGGSSPDAAAGVSIEAVRVPTLAIPAGAACDVLTALSDAIAEREELGEAGEWRAGSSLEYFAQAARLALGLMARQRVVPMLVQAGGTLRGAWEPWLSDAETAARVQMLVAAMPASARAVADALRHDAGAVTGAFLGAVVDAECRAALARERFDEAIEGRDASNDQCVAWLAGLLGPGDELAGPPALRGDMARRVRAWIGSLEERGPSAAWRLLLRLAEPLALDPKAPDPAADEACWTVSFHLQAVDAPGVVLDAPDIWLIPGESATIMGRRIDRPQDLLLGELGRASRVYRTLEGALEDSQPSRLRLTTKQAYEFLREVRPILVEQGFGVDAPAWWDAPSARLGARLRLESKGIDPFGDAGGGLSNAARAQLGLSALVGYTWEIAVGDLALSLREFEQLAAKRTPLVRINGRWVEVRPEDVQAAIKFIRDNPGGEIRLGEALRLAYASDLVKTGIPVVGLEATGWLQAFFNSEAASRQLAPVETPATFHGALRPYQQRGVSWMVFQEHLGFGICLADDMGLGKTVQLLALLAHEREIAKQTGQAVRPTLLLVPMSVVGNWMHETARFCPDLTLLVHHGQDRSIGDAFVERVEKSDLIVTTYALAHRDRESLGRVEWGRVVLDEAQYIKNPTAKQSQAVRALRAQRRVALTGTPVENRLTELWSIMDFLNPGYLGSSGSFRTKFALPIERYRDRQRSEQLRGLIRPFVLRRLKSDPTVVADLPEKVESREYTHLTAEQASLYQNCVKRMLGEVEQAEGMQRRGLVLAALVRLKQLCDHPTLVLQDGEELGHRPPDPSRSGKCIRLLEMLDEVLAEGDQALVFTQFREMGALLEAMLRHQFGKDVLFIHGGTSQPQRQAIIDRFQKADGTAPVLILSLRAGGVGLNLTAATHVFHFDRWWNPAVENQATDRAYRIGQTRTVQVHKFVVRGTLEERIDQMIESKTELAENIIGAGEGWLSDLSTDQLRDILTLRNEAVDDEV
ncbi:MAG: DEAD/DEAH box helicase [Planctomycetota bacterium]|nr:DEAD/DEAH box helicase [Planctomycetota bacterium]